MLTGTPKQINAQRARILRGACSVHGRKLKRGRTIGGVVEFECPIKKCDYSQRMPDAFAMPDVIRLPKVVHRAACMHCGTVGGHYCPNDVATD